MEPIESSETSAYNNTVTPGTYPKEKKLQSKHGKSLKQEFVTFMGRILQDTSVFSRNFVSNIPSYLLPLLSFFAAETITPFLCSYKSNIISTPELQIEYIDQPVVLYFGKGYNKTEETWIVRPVNY